MGIASREAPSGSLGPEVSCVVPTYRDLELVARCLTSVAAQRDVRLEIIVTDDSPTSVVADFITAMPGLRNRVRYLAGPRNGNPVDNWNVGLTQALAPVQVLVHQDEFLVDPTYLRKAADALGDESVAAVTGGVVVIGVARPSRFGLAAPIARRMPGARRLLPLVNWIGPTAAFVFRAGWRFDPAMVQLADVEFYGRVLASGRLARLPGVVVGSLGHHDAQISARIDPEAMAIRELAVLAGRRPPAISPLARAMFSAVLAAKARARR